MSSSINASRDKVVINQPDEESTLDACTPLRPDAENVGATSEAEDESLDSPIGKKRQIAHQGVPFSSAWLINLSEMRILTKVRSKVR